MNQILDGNDESHELQGITEALLGMKRAGADGILTYFAKRVATMLQEQRT